MEIYFDTIESVPLGLLGAAPGPVKVVYIDEPVTAANFNEEFFDLVQQEAVLPLERGEILGIRFDFQNVDQTATILVGFFATLLRTRRNNVEFSRITQATQRAFRTMHIPSPHIRAASGG